MYTHWVAQELTIINSTDLEMYTGRRKYQTDGATTVMCSIHKTSARIDFTEVVYVGIVPPRSVLLALFGRICEIYDKDVGCPVVLPIFVQPATTALYDRITEDASMRRSNNSVPSIFLENPVAT